ncbi:MAG: N-acetylmuramoyl-L-alanine amidase [Candidatus Eremiobacterota bacterium]
MKKLIIMMLLLASVITCGFCAENKSTKIINIDYKENSSGGELVIQATGPVKYTSQLLTDPLRIAVDIPGTVLLLKKNKDINNEIIKNVKAIQNTSNSVRVVMELKKPVSVRIASRINLDQIKLRLSSSNGDIPVSDTTPVPVETPQAKEAPAVTNTQQIREVKFEEKNDIRRIFITTTGPVTYEWHRLKSPDSRIYIDFTDAILVEKKLSVPVDDEIISDIRVAQNRKSPNVVRVVFKLNKSVKITFSQSQTVANQLIMEMGKDTVDETSMATIGTGAIGYLMNTVKTIVIDPGHGGGDYGAINPSTGLAEKDMTLDISLRLQELLIQEGWNAILTHSTDRDVTSPDSSDSEELWARANIGNKNDADIFLSIHCDSSSKQTVRGTTTFFYKDIDKSLASVIHKYLISDLGTMDRGIKSSKFYVLKNTKMPAALLEIAFISNSEDARLLSSSTFRQKVAKAIFEGICEYTTRPAVVGGK